MKNYIILVLTLLLTMSACNNKEASKSILFLVVHPEVVSVLEKELNEAGLEVQSFPNTLANSSNVAIQQGYLLTGQHPLYSGAFDKNLPLNSITEAALPQIVKQAGFKTYFVGDWLLKDNTKEELFDVIEDDLENVIFSETSTFLFYFRPTYQQIGDVKKLLSQVKNDCFIVVTSCNTNSVNHSVPLIFAGNKMQGGNNDLLFSQMNLMPTVLSLQGLQLPKNIAKRNMSRLIKSGKSDVIKSVPLFNYSETGYWGAGSKNASYFHYADSSKGFEVYPSSLRNNTAEIEKLNDFTRVWMRYFGDEHFGYDSLMRVMPIEDWLSQKDPIIIPIDELKKLHSKTIMNFHGNLKYE